MVTSAGDPSARVTDRLGVMGGSFNPPHLGHLIIASQACVQLGLGRVLFVVAATPPHKEISDAVDAAIRLEMTRLAVAQDARFAVSDIEIVQSLVYTADTLAALQVQFPGSELCFVLGSDSLAQFASWERPSEILSRAALAVAPRPGDDLAALRRTAAHWGRDKVTMLASMPVSISSSEVRRRVRVGASISYLVPAVVEAYITKRGLYRAR
jgi:nicotinate-nucleotide adenylyltransferase